MLALPCWAGAQHLFEVRHVDVRVVDGLYRLDADIHYRLKGNLQEALHNGVPLGFEVQVEILRNREWLWKATEAGLSQRYRLEYHALSALYVLTHLNTGLQRTFHRLESALAAMGDMDDVPLLDVSLLDDDGDYTVRLRSLLRVDELPLPLRARGYVFREWRPESGWYERPLR